MLFVPIKIQINAKIFRNGKRHNALEYNVLTSKGIVSIRHIFLHKRVVTTTIEKYFTFSCLNSFLKLSIIKKIWNNFENKNEIDGN